VPDPRIRPATTDDAAFLAWVMQEADRMGGAVGGLDLIFNQGEVSRLGLLALIARSDVDSVSHYSRFVVAEVDGVPAAALAGYVPDEIPAGSGTRAIQHAAMTAGWPADAIEALLERAARYTSAPYFRIPIPGDTLRVEWVATRAEFRGRGLNWALHEALFERARASGLRTAHVGTAIGNEPALAAYRAVGFQPYAEVRHRDYEAVFGRPGHVYLRRDL
jgi:ribosomal protein S18 acetylase RimI-like enzyme